MRRTKADSASFRSPIPTAEHERLTAMVGDYDVATAFWFAPGTPPTLGTGRSRIRAVLGGLFIEEELKGRWGEVSWTTLSRTGYNTSTREYEATRISSTNTITIVERGSYDPEKHAIVFVSEYPFAGETWRQRDVIGYEGRDSIWVNGYLAHGNGPEWKALELRYKRRR